MYVNIKLYFLRFGFYRMQGGIEAEREERERWINKDVKKMIDSVAGTASYCCYKKESVVYSVYHSHLAFTLLHSVISLYSHIMYSLQSL